MSRARVDVIVTDGDGQFVDDLRREDFVLFEDGEPQPILDMQLVDLRSGTVISLGAATAVSGPESSATGRLTAPENVVANDVSATPQARGRDLGAMVFLIDGLSLDPRAKNRFARGWEEWIEQAENLTIPRAAYAITPAGTLQELVPLTYETEPFRETVDVIREFSTFGTSILGRMRELTADLDDAGDRTTAGFKARSFEIEEVERSLQTLRLLEHFCNALSGRPGRTALVWVSMGVKLTTGGPYTELVGVDPFDTFALDGRIVERQQQLHEAANNANVSIYGVDPTLSSEQRSMGFDMSVRSADLVERAGTPEVQSALDGFRHSLSNAAIATGGQTFLQASDLSSVLQTIESDTGRFYLLSYEPPMARGDGQYHEIKVEVSRPGVRVRERGGYIDLPAEDRETRRVTAALALPGMATELPVLAKAFRRWSPTGRPMVQLAVGLDTRRARIGSGAKGGRAPLAEGLPQGATEPLTEAPPEGGAEPFAEGPANTWQRFHAMAIAGRDVVAKEAHQEVRSLSGSLSDDTVMSARPFVYYVDWGLDPADYSIRVVLEDALSDRLGGAQLDLEVPEPTSEWQTSDLILALGIGNEEPRPLIDGRVTPDDTLLAYLEVKHGRDPVLSGRLLDADGTLMISQLPSLVLARDRFGLHRGALRLRGIPPGSYLLQVTVADESAAEHRVFLERLEVVR